MRAYLGCGRARTHRRVPSDRSCGLGIWRSTRGIDDRALRHLRKTRVVQARSSISLRFSIVKSSWLARAIAFLSGESVDTIACAASNEIGADVLITMQNTPFGRPPFYTTCSARLAPVRSSSAVPVGTIVMPPGPLRPPCPSRKLDRKPCATTAIRWCWCIFGSVVAEPGLLLRLENTMDWRCRQACAHRHVGEFAARAARRARLVGGGGAQRADGARHAVFHKPHGPRLAVRVRLAPADGDQDAVAGVGIDQVTAAQGAHLAPAHPGHKQQASDHCIETSPFGGHLGVCAAGNAAA